MIQDTRLRIYDKGYSVIGYRLPITKPSMGSAVICSTLTAAIVSIIGESLWAVVNLNSNRTCPVCTGQPDNSVY